MKPKFSDLTPEQQATFGNGCGLQARLLRVPQFIFKASCRQHDFNYTRGGGIKDKIKADWDFFKAMLEDSKLSSKPCFYTIMSVTYFLGVSLNPVALYAFTWGEYLTIDEILRRDFVRKNKNKDFYLHD
jgi:hypothetical protein